MSNNTQLDAFNFDITFWMPQFTTVTLAAKTIEEAQAKVEEMLQEFKDGKIVSAYRLGDAPAIEAIVKARAEQQGIDIYKDVDEVLEPVHDTKELN